MDDVYCRSSLRERILNDLRNVVKQVYHEAVNNELSSDNKTYICLTLIRNLDEALRHGLKQLHLGYWKPISKILHPEALQAVEKLQVLDSIQCDGLLKGRAWIALSLKEESFSSYIQCLVTQSSLNNYYENWSILRTSDSCNRFLSILTGLDNVIFIFELEHYDKLPRKCSFKVRKLTDDDEIPLNLNGSKSSINLTTSSTSLTSPVDSGVHIQDSASEMEQLLDDKQIDIDFLNGNVPETVLLRKSKKNSKRHVSFHEDIIYKSPEKCRRLKWDSENLRYSWSGEQLDSSILKEIDFTEIKKQNKNSTPIKTLDINERGVPEGEESPFNSECMKQSNLRSQKSIIVRRFLQSIKKQNKIRHLHKKSNCENDNYKRFKIDSCLVDEINNEIKRELDLRPKVLISKYEVCLNECIVKDMIKNQSIYKTFKLKDFLFIITNANVYLISKNLETRRISFRNLCKIIVYPDSHAFLIYESDEECHTFITGDRELTSELLGRLELAMRRNLFDPPLFTMLDFGDLSFVKKILAERLTIEKKEELVYCGAVLIDREYDLVNSFLPTTKRGFLMYKDMRAGDSWIPGDFYLKNGILYLFEDDSSFPKLAINIATGCQSCNRTKNADRPHTFQISLVEKELEAYAEPRFFGNRLAKSKHLRTETQRLFSEIRQKMNKLLTFVSPKNNGCAIEFAAANEFELSEWLQMIIQASCGDFCEEAHKEELMEGTLWLTKKSLVITNVIFSPQSDLEIISCAQLRDIAAFRIGESDKDFFTVILTKDEKNENKEEKLMDRLDSLTLMEVMEVALSIHTDDFHFVTLPECLNCEKQDFLKKHIECFKTHEFFCMEACSTSGDWILYMSSRDELENLKSTLQKLWKLNIKFPCEYLKEGRLMNRCRKSQENWSSYYYWTQFLQ